MGLQIVLGSDRCLHVTVFGDFDFELSRTMLIGVKRHWRAGVTDVLIVLKGVTRISSAAIGTLALLADMAGSRVAVQNEDCAAEVHALFASDLLSRHISCSHRQENQQNVRAGT